MRVRRDFHQPRRSAAVAGEAMAATSHPLATLTAIEVLKDGGSAADAAIAASAVLCVAEPQATGIGGDCFVLYAPAARRGSAHPVQALNGSGMAPAAATCERLQGLGLTAIAADSPHAVTVPGTVDAWWALHRAHGKLDFARLLAPAIRCAENGVTVAPRVAFDWQLHAARIGRQPATAAVYFKDGAPFEVGDRFVNPGLAKTLRKIAAEGRACFYSGPVATELVASLKAAGGLHTEDDFALQHSAWVVPIKTSYEGYEVFECPPNGQGIVALMLLNILGGMGYAQSDAEQRVHLLAEATKLAMVERDARLGDPSQVEVPTALLLSAEHAAQLRARIDPLEARYPQAPLPMAAAEHKDTVYLTVVDRDGNAVSFISSLFESFGSTLLGGGTGVLFHNRGMSFRLDPSHPNAIGPRRRPLHTIIPGMLVKDGGAVMPFGVMGGHYQPVGQAQLVMAVLDDGLDPQAALELPRSFAHAGALQLETTIPDALAAALARRGHHEVIRPEAPLGGGQAIWIDHARGVLVGGSDPRKDGCALGY